MAFIKVSFGALREQHDALGGVGGVWDELLVQLDEAVAPLRATWDGEASQAYEQRRAEWLSAADELRDVLRQVRQRSTTIQDNYGRAAGSAVRLWGGGGAVGGSDAGDFEIALDDVRLTVREIADIQARLLDAVEVASAELRGITGMAGPDSCLARWRDGYDVCRGPVADAVAEVVSVLGDVSMALKDTGNTFAEAEEASGGGPVDRIPFPGVKVDYVLTWPPTTGGPGKEAVVPDEVTRYWPNAWEERLHAAADTWSALARALADANTAATQDVLAMVDNNSGAVFSVIRDYWSGLCSGDICAQDAPFDRTYAAVQAMSSACRSLAMAIEWQRARVEDAVALAGAVLESIEPFTAVLDTFLTRGLSRTAAVVAAALAVGLDVLPDDRYLTRIEEAVELLPSRHLDALGRFTASGGPGGSEATTLSEVKDVVGGELAGKWNQVHGPHPRPDQIHIPPERVTHILDGDKTGGGHRAGSNNKKSHFPAGWTDETTISKIESVARNPDSIEPNHHGRWKATGTRDGVLIEVIVNPDGTIRTAWPVSGPGVRPQVK
ncbi:WXG100 family type VII secretion target [Amycolatopsis arida]|uniref:WXG100 family type VII secretion target n=1 Tax=Amycolatopsis arida TaxID=587909 RepID=A0A1I5TCM3_9PSEU|nr:EndoU domain-containing protein [Amycolatopsis arida]TDX96150.1 WXG100 family type VII secretion target [Amycolatopsis arida]SFP80571.1 WXG100 family type VII secretion target [Amycolatopsis arida]